MITQIVEPSWTTGPSDEGTSTPRASYLRSKKKWVRPTRRPKLVAPEDRWVNQSRSDFFDARVNPIKPHHLKMHLILETFARFDCFCFPGSQELAGFYGCNRRQVLTIITGMEEEGLILRVLGEDEADPDRLGFILLRRSDPNMPVANTPELVAQAKEDLRRRRNRPYEPTSSRVASSPPSGGALDCPGGRAGLPGGALLSAPPMRQLLRDNHSKTTTEALSSFSGEVGTKAVPVSSPIPQPIEVAPAIAEALVTLDHPTDRVKLQTVMPELTNQFGVVMVLRMILELKAKRAAGHSIGSVGAWAAGLLRNWKNDNKVSCRLADGEIKRIEAEARREKAIEAERIADQAKRAKQADAQAVADHQAALKARWESLPESERETIRVRVRVANPEQVRLKSMIELLCLAEFDKSE